MAGPRVPLGILRHCAGPSAEVLFRRRSRGRWGIGSGVCKRKIDTEDFHEDAEAGVAQFLKARIEEIEQQLETGDPGAGLSGRPTAPLGKVKGSPSWQIEQADALQEQAAGCDLLPGFG